MKSNKPKTCYWCYKTYESRDDICNSAPIRLWFPPSEVFYHISADEVKNVVGLYKKINQLPKGTGKPRLLKEFFK